jgi:hypothetical protein
MPLNLHENCLAQLRASLEKHLPQISVTHGMFLATGSTAPLYLAQTALPTTGKVHARLLKLIGEMPLIDFVSGTLARELVENQSYETELGPKPITSMPAYSNAAETSAKLVDAFESLPWQYTITLPLPVAFSDVFCPSIKYFSLSDFMCIRCGNEEMATSFPLVSGIKGRDERIAGGGLAALLIPQNPEWKADRAYLQIQVEGFIGKFASTEPLHNAVSLIRAFFGLGLALRLFQHKPTYQQYPRKQKAFIHRSIDKKWVIEDLSELESAHSSAIDDLQLHDLDGTLNTPEKRGAWMRQKLGSISAVIKAADRAQNITLGAQWLLDSYSGSDELLQFVQAAVVVEILLGEKASSDLVGLGELLSNRCAYLIANSHAERAELLQDFRTIYEVRSKIVHRGKSRLQLREKILFDKLRWMCRRIIQEEVKLLEEDANR